MMPQTARANNNWRRQNAEEELRIFDREVTAAWRSARSTIATAMQATGCEGEKPTADDHLTDLFADVFVAQRIKLLRALDDHGGDMGSHPWPIDAEKEAA